ncbi:MAG: FtsB family cell division protein [Halanaerobiaceae bacterium]
MTRKKLLFRVGIIIVLFLIVYGGFKFYNNYLKIQDLKRDITKLESKISTAREEKQRLQIELKNIDDPEYIENIARKELGLVKPGELLIIPIDEDEEKENED